MLRIVYSGLLLGLLSIHAAAWAEEPLASLAAEALARLNERRSAIGLSPLQPQAALERAAAAHLSYLLRNHSLQTEGHLQSPGRSGFTGRTPAERIAAAGYAGASSAENLALVSYPSGALCSDNLIDAPYHRAAQFGAYREAGVAMGSEPAPPNSVNPQQYVYVIAFGGDGTETVKDREGRPLRYPYPGQREVPADWIANESPNPLPDMPGRRVGYPISVIADPGEQLRIERFRLSGPDDQPVTGRLITRDSSSGQPLEHHAFWIPLAPLAYDTLYTAEAQGSLNGRPLTLRWQFRTRAAAPLRLIPSAARLGSTPGSSVSVQLQGGSGNQLAASYAGHRYQFYGRTDPGASFVNVRHAAPDTVILTRNGTPCSKPLLNCAVLVKGKDSTGSEVSLVLPVD